MDYTTIVIYPVYLSWMSEQNKPQICQPYLPNVRLEICWKPKSFEKQKWLLLIYNINYATTQEAWVVAVGLLARAVLAKFLSLLMHKESFILNRINLGSITKLVLTGGKYPRFAFYLSANLLLSDIDA